jgi:drug/metabolite transporter (DMT)-like permease
MPRSGPSSGIALRLLSVFLLTAMSATVHAVAQAVPVGQIMFWRSLVALAPICLYAVWLGHFPKGLGTRRPGLHVTRSLFGAFSMAMSFVSLAYLPVANAQALAYLAPVFTLPLAAVLLKEKLNSQKIAAVVLGFSGVVIMLWSALETPGAGALIGVSAGLAYALTMAFVRVHVKKMTDTEMISAIAFYFSIVCLAVSLLTLPFGWVALDWSVLGGLVLAGLLGGAAHIASGEAIARAPVSTLAPFDFTGLIWAVGFDLVLFAVLPDQLGVIGMVLILGAAVFVTLPPRRSRAQGNV